MQLSPRADSESKEGGGLEHVDSGLSLPHPLATLALISHFRCSQGPCHHATCLNISPTLMLRQRPLQSLWIFPLPLHQLVQPHHLPPVDKGSSLLLVSAATLPTSSVLLP